MKVESRSESTVGAWEGLSRFLPQGVTLFATGLSGLLLILIGLPVLMVILMSLRTGFPGENVPFTLENFATVYLTPRTYEVLLNTVFFAISSVSITLLIAVPLVWILMRTDVPFKKTIYVLLTIGILIPVFLRTIAWILLLSPRIGLVNKWLQEVIRSQRAAVQFIQPDRHGIRSRRIFRARRFFHARRRLPIHGPVVGGGGLHFRRRQA